MFSSAVALIDSGSIMTVVVVPCTSQRCGSGSIMTVVVVPWSTQRCDIGSIMTVLAFAGVLANNGSIMTVAALLRIHPRASPLPLRAKTTCRFSVAGAPQGCKHEGVVAVDSLASSQALCTVDVFVRLGFHMSCPSWHRGGHNEGPQRIHYDGCCWRWVGLSR